MRVLVAPPGAVVLTLTLVSALSGAAAWAAPAANQIELVTHKDTQRVDVTVDGQPFTTYRWDPALKKPVLYPIRAASGGLITRGWPVEPRPDEATDHPHHLGSWLNYGNVDGVDFWNNSDKRTRGKGRMGTVVHRSIKTARGGKGQGVLEVNCDWVDPEGKVLLTEETRYVFSAADGRRSIERTTNLHAKGGPVTFPDNKEGVFGLRLARELEHPGDKNPAGTGKYRSSEGIEGKDVWGTRGRWMMLTARIADQPLTVAILDHPGNPGFPTHWHARPWGLFAANPLGQNQLSKGERTLNFALPKGQTARFNYKILVLGKPATPAEIEAEYRTFTGTADKAK
jgi:hypothetical protein